MSRNTHSGNSDLQLYFLQIKGLKEGERPYLKQSRAEGDKIVQLEEKIYDVSGSVHKLEIVQREYEGVIRDVLRIWLVDREAGEMYILSVEFNMVGRSVMNQLLSIKDAQLGELMVSVYMSRSTKRPAAYVEHNSKSLSWAFSKDDTANLISTTERIKKVKDKDGVVSSQKVPENNYDALNEFLLEKLKSDLFGKVAPHIPSSAPTKRQLGPPTDLEMEAANDTQKQTADDLPF